MLKSINNSKARTASGTPNDRIFTPRNLSKEIIDSIQLTSGDVVLEPFRGDGSFYDQYPDYVTKKWCEIDDGVDFLEYDENEKVDWIITNPPFSLLTKMIEKMAKITIKGIAFICMLHAVTKRRHRIFESHGFNLTHIECFHVTPLFGFNMGLFIYEKNKPSLKKLKIEYKWEKPLNDQVKI